MPSTLRCLLPCSRREAQLGDWGLRCVEGLSRMRRSQRGPIRTQRCWHGVHSPVDCRGLDASPSGESSEAGMGGYGMIEGKERWQGQPCIAVEVEHMHSLAHIHHIVAHDCRSLAEDDPLRHRTTALVISIRRGLRVLLARRVYSHHTKFYTGPL